MNIYIASHYFVWMMCFTKIEYVRSHLPKGGASTPASAIDVTCELADRCIHDTILICGEMGEKRRTFLDLCDMLEYGCDSNEIYRHVSDVTGSPGCPTPKPTLPTLVYVDLAPSSPLPKTRRMWLRAMRRQAEQEQDDTENVQ